jgi:hypothetical protein
MAALAAAGRQVDVETWTRPDAIVEPRPELASLYDEGFAFYRHRLDAARGHWTGPMLTPA